MSETKVKSYKIIKTTPNNVLFNIHPLSNPMLTRRVYLTAKNPQQILPLDWALGVFADDDAYSLFKNKKFTFDNNDDIALEAFNAGVYFDDKLDFMPAKPNRTEHILNVLKAGNRTAIKELIAKEGEDDIKNVAIAYSADLTQSVIRMLEDLFKIQLITDGE